MAFKVSAVGKGLAYLLGVGSIILAIMDKPAWKTFLLFAIIVWVIPRFLKSTGLLRRR